VAGQFDQAAEGYERAAVLLESTMKDPVPFAAIYLTLCLGGSGLNLWVQGYPSRALNRMQSAEAFASESGSKPALQFARYLALYVHGLRGEFEHARERGEALLALATELGDALRCAWSEAALGWLQNETGDLDGGVARMRRGLSAFNSIGAFGGIPYFLALMARALGKTGQFDEAFRAINDAVKLIERTGDRICEAEVPRLKGELVLAQNASDAAEAEQCFRTAIEISRKQHAKSWELRATTSLARLLRDTNRRDEARAMLAEIYNWFAEGFDTADLKDAKALLKELSN
jgi:adenylate cyclase